jgi:hypothetical protein
MKHGGLPTEEDYGGYLGQVNYSRKLSAFVSTFADNFILKFFILSTQCLDIYYNLQVKKNLV